MDLRFLRYFAEIAAAGSFSRAAARLHRSQPALSRAMRELEAELGVRLFERAGRGVVLGAGGRALLPRVRQLLAEADALAEQARLLAAGKTAVLRVGGVASLIERALPEILRRYRGRWPQVEVVLRPEGGAALMAALESGDVDLALAGYTESAPFESYPAFPFYVLAMLPRRHPLAAAKTLAIRDLAAERVMIAPPTTTTRQLFDAACQEAGIRPRITLESLEFNALVALAEAGQGVAVVPSIVDAAGRDVRAVAILHRGRALGGWSAVVRDRRRELPEHALDFARQACAWLQAHYPGRELRLPVPVRRPAQPGGETL